MTSSRSGGQCLHFLAPLCFPYHAVPVFLIGSSFFFHDILSTDATLPTRFSLGKIIERMWRYIDTFKIPLNSTFAEVRTG